MAKKKKIIHPRTEGHGLTTVRFQQAGTGKLNAVIANGTDKNGKQKYKKVGMVTKTSDGWAAKLGSKTVKYANSDRAFPTARAAKYYLAEAGGFRQQRGQNSPSVRAKRPSSTTKSGTTRARISRAKKGKTKRGKARLV